MGFPILPLMWQRLVLLSLLTLGCVSARSDDAKPNAPPGSTPDSPAPQSAAAVERVALLPTEARRAAELETAFPDDSIVRFGDGADRAIGVYRDAVGGKARGIVVVVLGSSLVPDAANDSTRLRRALPRERWATLTVALPDVPNETLPPRQHDKFVEGATAPAQPADAKPVPLPAAAPADPMPARVRARLDAAVKAAREKGGKVAVLGEDAVGAWIAWAQNQGLGADAIVAINTARAAPAIDGKSPKEALAAIASPALLLMETPHEWSPDDPLGAHVDLRHLPPGDPSGIRLERQISGWLKRRFGARE